MLLFMRKRKILSGHNVKLGVALLGLSAITLFGFSAAASATADSNEQHEELATATDSDTNRFSTTTFDERDNRRNRDRDRDRNRDRRRWTERERNRERWSDHSRREDHARRNRDHRENWTRRHDARRIHGSSWDRFWRGFLSAAFEYLPPYPSRGNDYYYAPDINYRRAPEPYYMTLSTNVFFRSNPDLRDSNRCGMLESGMYIPVVSFMRDPRSNMNWGIVLVDDYIRALMTNPRCYDLEYIYVARQYLY